MIFKETTIKDAYIVELEKIEDKRGFFARSFCMNEFADHNIPFTPVQENTGYSKHKYTLRGLHYQINPYAEQKLIRCIKGSLYDVIVDVRPQSPTYKQWFGLELSANNHTMLYMPKGCAHGYQTLTDDTQISYMVSAYYKPEAERGIRWDDSEIDIDWKESENVIVSEKDCNWPDFNDSNR